MKTVDHAHRCSFDCSRLSPPPDDRLPSGSPPCTPASPPRTRRSGWRKTKASSTNTISIRSLVYMRGTVPTIAALANNDIEFVQSGAAPFIPLRRQGRRRGAARAAWQIKSSTMSSSPILRSAASSNCAARPSPSAGPAIRPIITCATFSNAMASALKEVRLVQTGLQPERVAALRQGLPWRASSTGRIICCWNKRAINACSTSRISNCPPACAA